MSIDGDGKKLGELNHQLQGENKRFENVVNEDDIEVNDSTENINYRHEGVLQAPQAALQTCQRQQLKGSVDCWEKFLHLRSVKVLLVESDYSTRHVVNALLRNCYYEVIEAADGLQAWKMLEDLTIQIDLVLTEVDMPGLSGLGLLYKIMSHRTRNNVPVIMMSSHDSMGLVFKCLSKGAVDFLVKPIRKNELKNVWQHVWRRCHSSSGSGSESGTHTRKSVRSKSAKKCDNNTGSIDENDNGSMGLSVEDGSDNVSGNQSSWTKQAVEDSSRSASPEDQIAEGPDSTCAQVIFSNAEVSGNKQTSIIKVKECERCKEQLDDEPDKDEEKVVLGNIVSQFIHQVEDPNPNCAGPFPKSTAIEASTRQPPISDSNMKASDDADGTPYFEHGFKRLREEKDVETDQNVPKRSDSTAFSRKSGRPLDSVSGETVKTRKEPVLDLESHLNIDHSNRFSNVGSYSATKGDDLCAPQQILPKNADDAGIRKIQNHLCNHHGMQQPELSPDHADASLKKMAEVVPLCGLSYVYGGPAEGSGGNYHSVNESVSGSNHGSNQGSNTVVNNGGINIESGSGDGSGSGNRVDQNKFSRREAALAKFPENRKERFFQKKVRHQTRKKRGQIVRQTTNESSGEGSES